MKKGDSQRSSGSQVLSLLNESPFFEDIITQFADESQEEYQNNSEKLSHSYEDDIDRTIDKWSREANETLDQTDERKAAERKEYSPDNGKRKFITSADLAEAGELEPPARSGKRRASSAQAVSGANESYGDGSVPEGENAKNG